MEHILSLNVILDKEGKQVYYKSAYPILLYLSSDDNAKDFLTKDKTFVDYIFNEEIADTYPYLKIMISEYDNSKPVKYDLTIQDLFKISDYPELMEGYLYNVLVDLYTQVMGFDFYKSDNRTEDIKFIHSEVIKKSASTSHETIRQFLSASLKKQFNISILNINEILTTFENIIANE